MKKFEEELDKKVGTFDVVGHHNGVCCLVEEVKALGKDWVSPEDHILEIKENQRLRKENQRLRGIIGDMSSKIGKLKYQLEKQQPEIPEFVAEFITKLKKANNDLTFAFSSRVNECPAKYWNEAIVWRFNHPEEFAQAWVNGYTVKQKRFYLKHIDFCKRDKYYDRYIIKYDSGVLNHLRIEKGVLPQNVDTYFTQQEIDSMETGSYEQIEVEEKE